MPDPSPLKIDLEPGRHAICRCGKTGNAPFCDGSHQGSDVTPEILDVEQPQRYAWCICRTSENPPMCDGSHRKLWPPGAQP